MNINQVLEDLKPDQKRLLHHRLREHQASHQSFTHTTLVAWIKPNGKVARSAPNDYKAFLSERLPDYMVPSTILEVEEIPLNTNGKVDRQALEASFSKHKSTFDSEQEYHTIKATLSAIWRKYLGDPHLSVNDNFFDKGGDSLLAVQIIREAANKGIEIKIADLFKSPTIEAISKIVESASPATFEGGTTTYQSDIIVPLRTTGHLMPLFLIHEIASTIFMYRKLARHLDDDQPVYAIQSRKSSSSNIKELAEDYLSEIRKVLPEGPFSVGGYCFGGAVGFEIARLVESREGKAPHLVVIDAMFPNLVRYRLKYLIGFLQRETPSSLCMRFLKKIAVFYNRLKRFVKRERTNMKSEAEDTLKLSILPGQLQDMAKENYRAPRLHAQKIPRFNDSDNHIFNLLRNRSLYGLGSYCERLNTYAED